MASSALRLRRAISFSSALAARSTTTPSPISTVQRSPLFRIPFSSPPPTANSLPQFSSRFLHSTSLSLSSSRQYNHGDDQIDENTILFEGCDYKHWLITMDFPKDPRPTPEEMVETYVQTLAKVVGSVEEAKKRMYACSTTTYQGFQAEMDEETSQKFEGMPGVVFVLPDSYIDPVNKEYGGDKYINGTIIPRPPPVQYGRQRRQRDDQQRNSGYNRQQNDGTRPNFPSQQNYGAPQGSPQRGPMQNYPPQQNYAHSQNLPPQQNYASRQSYPPQQNYGSPRQGDRMDTMPPHNQGSYNQGSGDPLRNQRDYGHSQNFVPPSSSGAQYGQGDRGSYGQGDRGSYGQGDRGSYGQNQTAPPSFSRAQYGQGDRGSYGQNQTGQFGTGGSYGQGNNGQNQTGQYGNGTGMPYGQGNVSGYQQGYPAHEQNRQFNHPNGDQSTTGQKQQNFPSTGLPGRD